MGTYEIILAIIGGFIAGIINTLAGNGSAITLTILTEMLSLSPNVANATNRLGVFAQTAAGSVEFYRAGRLNISNNRLFIAPTIAGALIGAIVATLVSNEQFYGVFKFLLVFMFLVLLVKPERWLRQTDASAHRNPWMIVPAFLALGFYGGFIQMGMGIFFMAAMVLGGKFSIGDTNAIKTFSVGIFTFLVILIFSWKGLVDWKMGGILAIGQSFGGWLTARYAVRFKNADRVAYWMLVVIVVFALGKVFGVFEWVGSLFS